MPVDQTLTAYAQGGYAALTVELEPSGAPFQVETSPGDLTGEGVAIVVRYVPSRVTPSDLDEATLLVRASDGNNEAKIRLELSGRAIAQQCELPEVLDFGTLPLPSSASLAFVLRNPTDHPQTLQLGVITPVSGDPQAFWFENTGAGELLLGPNSNRSISVALGNTVLGSHSATIQVHAGPGCPPATVELRGTRIDTRLNWSPTLLDCGWVEPGTEVVRPIHFQNKGTSDVELTEIKTLLSSEFYVFTAPGADPTRLTVPASGNADLLVACRPSAPGVRSSQLVFQTSLPELPNGSIPIKMFGGDCLVASPGGLDFGTVAVACGSATRTVEIANRCSDPIVLTGILVSDFAGQPAGGPNCPGGAPCPEFFLVDSVPVPPTGLVLRKGDPPIQLRLKYRPLDVGTDTGSVELIQNRNGTKVTSEFLLLGTGTSSVSMTDQFVVPPSPVDVLLVIDNATSMAAQQASLTQNLSSLIQQIAAAPYRDMNFAVTTCDFDTTGERGRFVDGPGHQKVLHSSSASLESEFLTKVQVGTSGSETRRCVEAAATALTSPKVNTENAGFLRPDARLEVVWISNAPDQSTQTPTHWNQILGGIKPSFGWGIEPFQVSYRAHAINGFTSACPGDDGSYLPYLRPDKGSVSGDICDGTWGAQLASKLLMRRASSPFLTGVPDLDAGPLSVWVDGVQVAATDSNGDPVWTYSSVVPRVSFDPDHAPAPGAVVEIRYTMSCYP